MVRAPSAGSRYFEVKKLVEGASLHTICEETRLWGVKTRIGLANELISRRNRVLKTPQAVGDRVLYMSWS